jgi:hypothetical protein
MPKPNWWATDLDVLLADAYERGDHWSAVRLALARSRCELLEAAGRKDRSGLAALRRKRDNTVNGPNTRK